MDKKDNKQCPKCGKVFTCSHNATCWCMRYEISDEKSQELKENFDNCLCEECLKEYGQLKPE